MQKVLIVLTEDPDATRLQARHQMRVSHRLSLLGEELEIVSAHSSISSGFSGCVIETTLVVKDGKGEKPEKV